MLSYFKTITLKKLNKMKKQLKILVLFFMVWAPLGAQTFEKTIHTPTHDRINQVLINDRNEIVLFITAINQYSLPGLNLGYKNVFTNVVVLDESGHQIKQQRISSYDFTPVMDSSLESFYTYSGIYQNNQYLLSGTSRLDTPFVYANVIFTLDNSFTMAVFNP